MFLINLGSSLYLLKKFVFVKIHIATVSYSSLETDFWMQKKLDPLLFKIGRAQAAKNKWVEMGKQLVSRKVSYTEFLSYLNMLDFYEVQNW